MMMMLTVDFILFLVLKLWASVFILLVFDLFFSSSVLFYADDVTLYICDPLIKIYSLISVVCR